MAVAQLTAGVSSSACVPSVPHLLDCSSSRSLDCATRCRFVARTRARLVLSLLALFSSSLLALALSFLRCTSARRSTIVCHRRVTSALAGPTPAPLACPCRIPPCLSHHTSIMCHCGSQHHLSQNVVTHQSVPPSHPKVLLGSLSPSPRGRAPMATEAMGTGLESRLLGSFDADAWCCPAPHPVLLTPMDPAASGNSGVG